MADRKYDYWPSEPESPADYEYRGYWTDHSYWVEWYDDATREWTNKKLYGGPEFFLRERLKHHEQNVVSSVGANQRHHENMVRVYTDALGRVINK